MEKQLSEIVEDIYDMGAGESTVFDLITGNYGYEGKIEFQGKKLPASPLPYRPGGYRPYVPESTDLWPTHTAIGQSPAICVFKGGS